MIQIFVDSGANLSAELREQYNIHLLPMALTINDQPAPEGLDGHEYYEALRSGADVRTSMVNPDDAKKAFETYVSQGDDVVYFSTKYVDEALNYKTKMKKPIWIKWGIMAACLCLIICVVAIPRLLNGSNPPISGDLAPMVYVNNKLYQYTDSQLDFTDKESQFTYLGEIESKVSSSQEPKENFQANDDIVGAKVYQYENNIVVLIDGKYFLYSHMEDAENETVEFEGQLFNKSDLSEETLEWLEWYNSIPPEKQLAVNSIPAELYTDDGVGTVDADQEK